MLGICTMLMAQPGDSEGVGGAPYLAAAQDGDQIVAAALRTPPHNVVLSMIGDAALPAAAEEIARDLYAAYATGLPGAIGLSSVSRAFAEHWQTVAEQPYHLGLKERIYKLERVQSPTSVPGRMRRAIAADSELLARWVEEFDREALGGREIHDGRLWVETTLAAPPDLRGLYVWEDGDPVSLAGYGGRTPHGMRIGPVYTPPDLRDKGYASALTAGVSQMLLDSGRQFVSLFTDLANPTSNHIYQQIGYRPVCDVDVYEFAS
jgi:predicted GNAT family acetyltransferase